MPNKLIDTAARTTTNLLVLGVLAAATFFAGSLLLASGQRIIDTAVDDFSSLRSNTVSALKKAA